MLLRDEELVGLDPGIIRGLDRSGDLYRANSPIQPASVDLSIGNIYLPEVKQEGEGSLQNPLNEHYLSPGHTAIVQTKEELDLPANLAAIGFPPSSVSTQGLLMTNPGHVDPGYRGRMKFTLINMGRQPYRLKSGEIIVTLLLFRLDHPAKKSYSERNPNINTNVTRAHLSKLAAVFLDFERRAEDVAKRSVHTARWWNIGAPVVAMLLGVIVIIVPAYFSTLGTINELDKKVIETRHSLDKEISNINNRLERQSLEIRIEELERLIKKGEPRSPKP